MKPINFRPARGVEPKEPREGTRTATVLKMLGRKNGCTLSQLAKELDVEMPAARSLVSKSYLAPMGYDVTSEETKKGDDPCLHLVTR